MKKLFSHKNKMLAGGLLIALSTLVSCKKLIQIPSNPATQITRQEAFADSASALTTIAGVYSYTSGGHGIPYYDGILDLTTALAGHEVSYTGVAGDLSQFYTYKLTSSATELSVLWSAPYAAIYQVNDVLAGVTNNSALSAPFVKQVTGEMKVARAFYYFNLVNIFGGVPLVTTTDYNVTQQLPRTTPAAIYTQITTDLNDAVKKLTAAYPTYPNGTSFGKVRPNLYTAIALQAKVNLYLGNWQAAYNEADSVIRLGGFSLVANLNNVFADGSTEAIWQVPVETVSQQTGDALKFLPIAATLVPGYVVTDSLLNQFDTGDQRKTNWLGINNITTKVAGQTVVTSYYYANKYKNKVATTPATDFMLLRFAEMYLIRAEAAAQLNNLGQALKDINTIRTRAGLAGSTANATSQTAVLAAVRKERRTELCFEFGNRWFDLNRTINDTKYPANGQATAVLAGYSATNGDNVYPIPLSQILLTPNLTQNPGYH